MRKSKRILLILLLLGILAMSVVFTLNTLSFSSRQVVVKSVEPIVVSNEVADKLSELIQLPTVSFPEGSDTLAFLRLREFFSKNYPFADSLLQKEIIGKFSFLFKWPGQNARLAPVLLLAHLDVLPVEENSHEWNFPPFGGKISEGYIQGRGSLGGKASVCAIMEAVEMLLQQNYSPERDVWIAFGHDKEAGGYHGAKIIADTLRQKAIRFEFIVDGGHVFMEDALPGLSKPLAVIGIAEKGYATIDLSVSLPGDGHPAMPPQRTAIGVLSRAITRIQRHPSSATIEGPLQAMLEHAGPETSLPYKIIFANLSWTAPLIKWKFARTPKGNAMLRTTCVPTVIQGGFKESVLPAKASAKINCRILPGESVRSVLNYVYHTIDDEQVVVSLAKNSPQGEPLPLSGINTFGYTVLQTTIREIFPDVVVAPTLSIETTDSRHYRDLADDIFRFQPVNISSKRRKPSHDINEKLELEQFKQAVRFYRQLILNACK